jgi:hypothetical protein
VGKRKYFGEEMASELVNLWNHGFEEIPEEVTKGIARIRACGNLKEREELLLNLNTFLSDYKMSPQVTEVTGDGLVLGWFEHDPPNPFASSSSDKEGVEALWLWLQLAAQGQLSKLKRCPVCAKWFFAKSTQNQYESEKCRKKATRQDPKKREARRAWERDHYHRQRERDHYHRQRLKKKETK